MKNHKARRFAPRIMVRLWVMMMLLVAVSILFMWVVQIFLFERNYVEAAMAEVQGHLQPIMENLETEDLAGNTALISHLSKSINGKMILLNTEGKLVAAYSAGHPLEMQPDELTYLWQGVQQSEEYQQLLRGESYTKVWREEAQIMLKYELGIPVTYAGEPAYAFLYHSLDEVFTVLRINRQQLTVLSILLTGVAAVLAALLSRLFIRPIFQLKGTVDRLAKGDLEATPGLSRRDELGQLSDSIEQLGQALRRVEVLRKEVIANVSHEMRSPLALIMGYAEMVRDISWRDDVKREEDLNLIMQEAHRMSEMVKDIMDYSQFQAGFIQLNIEAHNLCEIVDTEVVRCKQSAAEHGIRIREAFAREEMPVRVDSLKMCLVMRNLLSNAINHTEDGGQITVSVQERDDAIRVSVCNPGDPIPEEDRDLIWERYQRSQHQGGRRQGTGIGLSIVSTILRAHAMPYGVDCENGQTVFWFDYPKEGPK